MAQINTFRKLILVIAGLILTILGIFPISQLGVAEMIFGNEMANEFIYPLFSHIVQWVAIVAIFTIAGIGIAAIINFIRNYGKPSKPSPELKAMNDLLQEIKGMREDWRKKELSHDKDKSME